MNFVVCCLRSSKIFVEEIFKKKNDNQPTQNKSFQVLRSTTTTTNLTHTHTEHREEAQVRKKKRCIV